MKRLFLLISLALLPGCDWFSQSTKIIQGSGSTVRQERSIQGVDEIKLSGVGKLILKQGESESLVIEADENILSHIVSQVEGDTLSIYPEDHALFRSKSEIIYHVILHKIKEIELSGSIEMDASLITADKLELKLSGSSRVKAALKVDKLKVKADGSAKIFLEGEAKKQTVKAAGSVQYDAGSLESERAKLVVAGASRVTVAVSKKLEVEASGVSVVSYKGNPQVIISSTGASSVQKVG